MLEKIKQVATRIKSLREISGISLDNAAHKLNISAEQLQKYESTASDIPVSILYELAGLYKVELTSLLTGEEPKMREYSLVRKGKGPQVERRKEYNYQDLAYNFKGKKAEIFFITVGPHDASQKHAPYAHEGQEFTYMLEGSLKVILDTHELELNTGDSLYFDPRHPHAMIALHNKPAKFLAVIIK
jgi:quercetin dioxygenase-like cupin family protein